MDRKRCFFCGGELEPVGDRHARCANPNCPSGGMPYQCEFCEEFSVTQEAGAGLTCHNKQCRMSERLRRPCPTCDKIAVIDFRGVDICLNRRCDSNAGRFSRCIFCGRNSLLGLKDYSICIKGHCEKFLVMMTKCFFCEQTTYSIENKACQNPQCSMRGVKVEPCPTCGARSRPLTPGQPGSGICKNPRCPSSQKPTPQSVAAGRPPALVDETMIMGPQQMKTFDEILGPAKKPPAKVPAAAPPPQVPKGRFLDDRQTMVERPPQPGLPPVVSTDAATVPARKVPGEPVPPPRPVPAPRPAPGGAEPVGMPQSALETMPASMPKIVSAPAPGGGVVKVVEPERPPEGLRAPAADSPLFQAFEFVTKHLLSDPSSGALTPAYLVVGTAGAGKTTYLSMLGEILRCRESKYYFPYEGIDVRRIQVESLLESARGACGAPPVEALKSHIKDLVFDFAQKEYSRSISKMQWPDHTPPDGRSSFFLVTELTRYQKPVARIVTFETSGEDFEAALKGFAENDPAKFADNPVRRILGDLMNRADGFVILMTPEGRVNDEMYRDFFLAIRMGLEARAMNVFSAELKARLGKLTEAPAPADASGGGNLSTTQQIDRALLDKMLKSRDEERRQKRRKAWEDGLRLVRDQLRQGDARALDTQEGQFVRRMEKMLVEVLQDEVVLKARQALSTGDIARNYLGYYLGLVDRIMSRLGDLEPHVPLEAEEESGGEVTKEQFEQALFQIRKKYGLSEEFRLEYTPELLKERRVQAFPRLKHLAIVFTKTDMYAAVHPPQNFPTRNLPGCKIHLDVIEDYLKLIGGSIRYYNTSAIGYSILRDTIYVPGPENTLTPINVIEPFFDMLGIG